MRYQLYCLMICVLCSMAGNAPRTTTDGVLHVDPLKAVDRSRDATVQLITVDPQKILETINLRNGRLRIDLPFSGSIECILKPFQVTTPQTRFVLGTRGAPDTEFDFDPSIVHLLRGTVVGDHNSSVVLAIYKNYLRGRIMRADGSMLHLASAQTTDTLAVRSPDKPFCGFIAEPDQLPSNNRVGGLPGPNVYYRLQMAIETDWEYRVMFESTEDAYAYVVLCYGLVGDIYLRDTNTFVDLTFIRIWETADDMFNMENPLGAFRTWWNDNMQLVPRNLAQFFSGRRDMPYGGAAYLSGICKSNGYSVMGYLMGFTGDITRPDVFNYDVHVAAHEIGHNCGTFHTHDYGIDDCFNLYSPPVRGSIMSYCSQSTSGGNAVTDVRFHTFVQSVMRADFQQAHADSPECFVHDCNGNGIADAKDILLGLSADVNGNGMPDECEDCNNNGVLDIGDILFGTSFDRNFNGVPDECEPDCNGNGFPDDYDISNSISQDIWGNGIPDECEADCDGNGQADYNQIQAQMDLDLNRDLILDACQDCDDDGILDLDALDGAWATWVGSDDVSGQVVQFHSTVGTRIGETGVGTLSTSWEIVITPDRRILTTSTADHRVVEFDKDGILVGDLVPTGVGGLNEPTGMAISPDGTLLVSSRGTNQVLEYNLDSGAFLGVFASGNPVTFIPLNMLVTIDGRVLVASANGSIEAWEYDSGTSLGSFVTLADNGGLADPRGIAQILGGDIVIASMSTNRVLRFDRATGAYVGQFNNGGTTVALTMDEPWGVRLGPEGHVYVSRHGVYNGRSAGGGHDDDDVAELHVNSTRIYIFDGITGNFIRSYVTGHDTDLWQPTGFDFMPGAINDCNHNGRHDACDIIEGTSFDLNGDEIPDECQCPADINGDGVMNVTDLLEIINQWGATLSPADVNSDGIVDINDLLNLIGNWGPCT